MGRPRDSRVDEAILTATRALLAQAGYAGLTMDAVAERAGIGKAAIYRRYATKQEMVFAAAVHAPDLPDPPDTGSLEGDLAALVQEIVEHLSAPAATNAVLGLVADIGTSAELAARFHETFVVREQEGITRLLERAVARGELKAVPDVNLVHALVSGPVFTTLYLQHRAPHGLSAHLGRVVAAGLAAGLDAEPPASHRHTPRDEAAGGFGAGLE
ncbi:TetR/AcrR family transcriptional regulator [Streptomyces sp. A3M-1-3]|uniref:TetR/AcrR family transcriptional regulator n=1 Tax=Streptomyces sp. A3M-1-3 TaxID=2962044 RepID=UPI0020B89AA2|nr:TetR/AcrR family transcriptional regulator [Streptomyces sp. A3M-1-3]MCP3819666.1 TetR/AcrR family transcriptional regulator [Streptomyces sp. A3M-1-3]